MKKISIYIAISIIIILIYSVSYSDVAYLRNGDVISGKIVTLKDNLCVFKTQYGASISLSNYEFKNLSTTDCYEFTFLSGEKIIGQLVYTPSKGTILVSRDFGEVAILPAKIQGAVKITSDMKTSRTSLKQKFGEEDHENPPLNFLTGSTVLLSPGTYEFEVGSLYKISREESSLMNIGYFQKSAYKARRLEISLSGRAGLIDKLEGWISINGT